MDQGWSNPGARRLHEVLAQELLSQLQAALPRRTVGLDLWCVHSTRPTV